MPRYVVHILYINIQMIIDRRTGAVVEHGLGEPEDGRLGLDNLVVRAEGGLLHQRQLQEHRKRGQKDTHT